MPLPSYCRNIASEEHNPPIFWLLRPRTAQLSKISMAKSTADTSLITQAQTNVSALSSRPTVLAAEEENIRRLQQEVYCIENTLRAIGKKNSCSKEVITLKAKLDSSNEELAAALEDQQHLRDISSEVSHDLLSLTSDEHQILQTPPGSPKKTPSSPKTPSTIILSDELQQLEDLLEQTPRWSLRWFEIKKEIEAETKKCEQQQLKQEDEIVAHDQTCPIEPHRQKISELQDNVKDETRTTSPPISLHIHEKKADNPTVYPKIRAPPTTGNMKNESIFRRMSSEDAESMNDVKTSPTHDSSASNHENKWDVTVKVISVDGLTAKKYEPKSKLPTQRKITDPSNGDTVTIVASFSQILSGKEFQTHLPSDPIEVETSVIPTQPFPQQLVEWPIDEEVDSTLGDNNIGMSTYQYSREFQLENQRDGKTSAKRFVPQMCPINISLSRRGKMLSLGKANLVITGEERGLSTIVIPISHHRQNSKVKNMKKLLKGSKSIPMARIEGDNVQFGLKNDAMLRVSVNVGTESRGERVQEAPASTTPSLKTSSSDIHEHLSFEEKVAINRADTTANVQLDKNIERIKASIKPFKETESELILQKNRSNSDDSLATGVLNDVNPKAASHPATRGEPKSNDTNLSPLKEELPKRPASKSSPGVDKLLLEVCTSQKFDIAEMWLHEGNSYHLINSYVQPSALSKSVFDELQEVYHGQGSSEQSHRLSMSMCKWAKKTGKLLWITEHQTPRLAQALKYSISGVHAAVAVPICHEDTNATVIYFNVKDPIKDPFTPDAEDYLTKTSRKMVRMTK